MNLPDPMVLVGALTSDQARNYQGCLSGRRQPIKTTCHAGSSQSLITEELMQAPSKIADRATENHLRHGKMPTSPQKAFDQTQVVALLTRVNENRLLQPLMEASRLARALRCVRSCRRKVPAASTDSVCSSCAIPCWPLLYAARCPTSWQELDWHTFPPGASLHGSG